MKKMQFQEHLLQVLDENCCVPTYKEPGASESEDIPVPFRYTLEAAKGNRTNCFRPNQLQGDAKTATAGALWLGKFESLPQSKLLDVLWEAPQRTARFLS